MLDYKIKELKRQIEPKEEQITDMKDQVKVSFWVESLLPVVYTLKFNLLLWLHNLSV